MFMEKSVAMAKDVEDPTCRMLVQEELGLYYQGICQWEISLKGYSKMLKLALKFGSRSHYDKSVHLMAIWNCSKGNFAKQFKFSKDCYDSCKKRGDSRQASLAAATLAHSMLMFDNSNEVIGFLAEERKLFDEDAEFKDLITETIILSLLILAYCYNKEWSKAKSLIDELMDKMDEITHPSIFYMYIGFNAMIESCIAIIMAFPMDDTSHYKNFVNKISKIYENHATAYPICQSSYRYARGTVLWMLGKKKRAFKQWEICLESAEKVDMPYEQALALYSLGKFDVVKHELSVNYLDQSMKIFRKLGASHQLEAVKRKKREKHMFTAALSFANVKVLKTSV